MPRKRNRQAKPKNHSNKTRFQKPTGKELDFLVLAGCSCLLTVLYHPVADALQSIHSGNSTQGAISAQVSRIPHHAGSMYLTVPPKREEIKEDEENQA